MPTTDINYDTYVEETRQMMQAARDQEAEQEFAKEVTTGDKEFQSLGSAAWGWTKRLPRNLSAGSTRALLNTIETADDAFEAGGQFFADTFGPVDRTSNIQQGQGRLTQEDEIGETEESEFDAAPPLQTTFPGFFDEMHAFLDDWQAQNQAPRTGSTVANVVLSDDMAQGVAQFAVPFTGYLKAVGGYDKVRKLLSLGRLGLAESVTAASAFEAHEGRVADLFEMGRQMDNQFGEVLNKVSPDGTLVNDYINWLGDRENEGEWEGRFKNAVDSVVTTAGLAVVLKGAAVTLRSARRMVEDFGTMTPRDLQRGSVGTRPPREVELAIDEGTGEHTARIPQVGEVIAQEGETAAGGTFINIKRADVVEGQRGTGAGVAMYQKLVDDAHAKGVEVWSDTMVSPDAVRVYEALERRGYRVKRNPATTNPNTGSLVSEDRNVPVFEVLPKETQ